jgi:putative inorganic carbon (hco3(-)) transporter
MFHIAGIVFSGEQSLRKLEWFSVAVLIYLSVIAVAALFGMNSLIFPRFILNESIGIHAERARGPFLQAVANGVCLNVLAIVALHSWERGKLRGITAAALLLTTPLALLATKTRAVWLGAVFSLAMLLLFGRGRRSQILAAGVLACATVGILVGFALQGAGENFRERLEDRSPVEFRLEMYHAGWQMFTEKPLLGWGNEANIQPEIDKRISGFRVEYYIFHNTYLELAVEHGLLGLALYASVFLAFFRLGSRADSSRTTITEGTFGESFGPMWRIALCVYLLNASVVVMNYQFLNAYVFTIAGILSAQARRATKGDRNANCLPV